MRLCTTVGYPGCTRVLCRWLSQAVADGLGRLDERLVRLPGPFAVVVGLLQRVKGKIALFDSRSQLLLAPVELALHARIALGLLSERGGEQNQGEAC